MKDIYVGNLSYKVEEAQLRAAFEQFGEVTSVNIVSDRATGLKKGFAFVKMPNDAEAMSAIAGNNEKELDGRAMRVNEAQPREDRPERAPRSGGFGDRNGGSNGGSRGGWGR